jgi:hypothetical protein
MSDGFVTQPTACDAARDPVANRRSALSWGCDVEPEERLGH